MNMIVIVDENWGIGKDGHLLAHFPEDLKFFKEKTIGKIVIMGSCTFKSLPNGALSDRINVILSKNTEFKPKNTIVFSDVNSVLRFVSQFNQDDVFVIGGEAIYRQFIEHSKNIYVTKIKDHYQADRFFPNLDKDFKDKFIPKLMNKINSNGIELEFWNYEAIDTKY